MTAALHHRGPDSHDVWQGPDGAVALGHARLAIVDLSEQGRQPMVSRSGRFVVAFNGEIYNHLDLRRELGASLPWRGHSDTETLLEAIEQWGVRTALEKSVGMFALALWDAHEQWLVLARDRMGEKPLYYGQGSHAIAFASELKALRHCPALDFSLDDEALRSYIAYGYVPGAQSAFRGVRKLPPGTWMTLRSPSDTPEPQPYWTLPEPGADNAPTALADDNHYLAQLEMLLERSVRQQMLSDVPLGAFLSGGIDSSLVVALMQRSASRPVKTFSMGVADGLDDESKHARKVAQHLGTDHTEMIVSPQDVLAVVPEVARIYDEPFADSSQIPTVLLSRLTRQHVTVALSGDAGDELFGGYNRHLSADRLEPLLSGPRALRHSLGSVVGAVPGSAWTWLSTTARAGGASRVPLSLDEKMARLARLLSARDGRDAYLGMLSQWLGEGGAPLPQAAMPPRLRPGPAGSPLAERMMWWDMQSYLPDDILVKVDRAAMSSSLETRVPFLDHRIVEFALRTPLSLKIRRGSSKWLLRELLARYVPRPLFERPKQGFTLPLDEWLRGPLRSWAETLLEQQTRAPVAGLDPGRLRLLWNEHQSRQRNHQKALWVILMLQAWMTNLKSELRLQSAANLTTKEAPVPG